MSEEEAAKELVRICKEQQELRVRLQRVRNTGLVCLGLKGLIRTTSSSAAQARYTGDYAARKVTDLTKK